MKKFPQNNFLEIFKGSHCQVNPLKRFVWLTDTIPNLKQVEPISQVKHEKLNDLETLRALTGKWKKSGVLRLSFDYGIKIEILGVKVALEHRGKKCPRPCMFGYGSQYAFYHYLNYFVEHSKFRFRYDDVFSSEFSLPSDFRIFFLNQAFWVEIKSTPPNLCNCRYYKNKRDPNPYPKYCVVVKALDEEMLNYEVYGYCTGSDVQKVQPKDKGYSVVHEIPLNREYFKPYSIFHEEILKLPLIQEFDDEHYIKPS